MDRVVSLKASLELADDEEGPSHGLAFLQLDFLFPSCSASRRYTESLFSVLFIFLIVTTADIISTVEFDHTGDYLATGDKGGRVVLFERNESVSNIVITTLVLRSWHSP